MASFIEKYGPYILFVIIMLLMLVTRCSAQEKNWALVDSMRSEIVQVGIDEPDIVLAQAIKESGWFNCTNCSWDKNNPFGFFYKGKYLSFDHWKDAVAYYKWWQDQLWDPNKYSDYYSFLSSIGYATAPNYIQELKDTYPLYNQN